MLKRSLAEFLGTYVLVLIGPGAVVVDNVSGGMLGNAGIALAFGVVVWAMIACLGKISGAHINPAVSLALTLSRHLERRFLLPYILAQLTGGIAAAFTLAAIWPDEASYGPTLLSTPLSGGILLEFGSTALLMASIYWSIHSEARQKYVSLIVGATVGLLAFFVGPLTGASMNPARSLGPALASDTLSHLWVYLVVTTLGALAVGFHYRLKYVDHNLD